MRTASFLLLATLAVPLGAAAEGWRHARVRHVEGGVSIQRAAEASSEEVIPNLPFLPGDRVWADDTGRVELQFADGSLVRMDGGSKLDYADHEGSRDRGRALLRLWSGALSVHVRDGRGTAFEVETPGGTAIVDERAVVRIDTRSGEVRVSVYDGEAEFRGDRDARVAEGERLEARRGAIELGPEPFDRSDRDEFALWIEERDERAYARNRDVELSDELLPYAGELDTHGSWATVDEVGYVWRPYVDAGWRPYLNGRWSWTPYGWTWIPYDPWGWAPFHYGRWGHRTDIGWYWIPGRVWGPAWVSWAVGPSYVGWCPLGYRDRPVYYHRGLRDSYRNRGRAIPRGTGGLYDGWLYARRSDLGARDMHRKIVPETAVRTADLTVAPAPTHRPDRELRKLIDARVADGRGTRTTPSAAPENVRTKPTPGDTVPELRSDPMTTIPFPTARRRSRERDEAKPEGGERNRRPTVRFGEAAGRGEAGSAGGAGASSNDAAPVTPPAGERRARPSAGERRPWGGAARRTEPAGAEAPRSDEGERPRMHKPRREDAERPASESRPREEHVRSRPQARPHREPVQAAPEASRPRGESHAAPPPRESGGGEREHRGGDRGERRGGGGARRRGGAEQ